MKYLAIGDPHVTPSELEDAANLMAYSLDIAEKEEAVMVILGDSFHTMNVLRLEVVDFWRSFYRFCKSRGVRVIAIRGNHDSGANLSALSTCEDLIEVVNDYYCENGILFASYTDDHKEYIEHCRESNSLVGGSNILFTHMTFNGAKYENGFTAPDGIDINKIHQKYIISGHIHTPQKIGKVTYIGAPRWRTISDANISRAIWLYDIENGEIKSSTPYSTDTICKRIQLLVDTEAKPVEEDWYPLMKIDDIRVDVYGTRDYVNKRMVELRALGAKPKPIINQDKIIKVKESDGLDKALGEFIKDYQCKFNVGNKVLKGVIRERLHINV